MARRKRNRPTQTIARRLHALESGTEILLNAFIGLRLNYAILKPLLGDHQEKLPSAPGRKLVGGLPALRATLIMSCALDIAKLTWDTDSRTASIANLLSELEDNSIVEALKMTRIAAEPMPSEGDADEHRDAILAIEYDQRRQRAQEVDDTLRRLKASWSHINAKAVRKPWMSLRNRCLAHLEVREQRGSYEVINPADLDLRRSDLGRTILAMSEIVADLNRLIRAADYDMARAEHMFDRDGRRLWAILLDKATSPNHTATST